MPKVLNKHRTSVLPPNAVYCGRGSPAEELGKRIGCHAIDTPHGTLIEEPKPFDFYEALAKLNSALNPRRCYCQVVHRSDCPQFGGIT